MSDTGEFAVRVEFRRDQDGRCYIGSPDLIGLHLAGDDLPALRRDLDTIIRDLVWFNHNRVIDAIRWIPSLDQVAQNFADAKTVDPQSSNETCVIHLEAA
jgi:hypothetical protein